MPTESEILAQLMSGDKVDDESGETVELDSDAAEAGDVTDTEDGGALIDLGEDDANPESEFYANLVEQLDSNEINSIATELDDLIAKDREARKKRDEQYEEGLKRTGLGNDAPGGAQFEGASKVVHPMLLEACIDFAARAIKELFPAGGPAKDSIVGEATADKVAKAQRKVKFLNWQLTQQMPEFRAELEQLLTQVPMGGVQYLKITWDAHKKRPQGEFVAVDDVFLPFAATNYYSSDRKTHRQYLTRYEYERRVRSGMYIDADLPRASVEPDASRSETANQKIEGKAPSAYNEDGLREVLEVSVAYEITDRKRKSKPRSSRDSIADSAGPAPYLITMDSITKTVLSVYRNWDEEDEAEEELTWMIEFPFVPWRGAYAIGLPHMIGGLSGAATGSLRALLDSGHINNFPGQLKLKSQIGGQSIRVDATGVNEIDGGVNADDIRKVAMPIPVNQPSPVLFQLLGFLVEAGKGVVKTTLDEANDNQNVPVGTTMARIEQGMVVFSAIHGRLHDAMGRVLKVLHRINATYLDDKQVREQTGEQLASRKDFDDPLDVIPVSDPNIFSEMQRFAQVQTIAQRADTHPQIYDQHAVENAILERMRIPNPSQYLIKKPEPAEMNAINENVAASLGRPIVAFPAQDHLAHIQAHLDFMSNPMLGMSPIIAPKYIPAMLQHVAEHIVLWYAMSVHDVASKAAGEEITPFVKSKDTGVRAKLDAVLAAAASKVTQQAGQAFSGVPPVLQAAMQMMAKLQPPQMQDPSQAMAAETARKSKADEQKAAIEGQKVQADQQTKVIELQDRKQARVEAAQLKQTELQQKAQADDKKMQLDAEKEAARLQAQRDLAAQGAATTAQVAQGHDQTSQQNTQLNADVKLQTNTDDNRTAMMIAAAEIEQDGKSNLSTGGGIGES